MLILSLLLPPPLFALSLYVVISALVLSLASPLATAAAGRASCHSSEGQWSGQLSPGTHHLHAVPSHPPRSHSFLSSHAPNYFQIPAAVLSPSRCHIT